MVEAGEASGTLDLSLYRMAVQLEKENRIRDKVKAATTYPMIVGCFAIIVVTALIVFIVPMFVSIFAQLDAKIPPVTQFLIDLSNFVKNQWILLICAVALLVFGWKSYKNSANGRYAVDRVKLKLPIIGKINIKLMAARFSRTLCTLISTGVPLPESMLITGRAISNRFAEKKVEYVEDQIKEGKTLSSAFAKMELLPSMLIQMTKIGEDTGTLDFMLERTADYYEQEAETAIQRLSTLLEPMMIIFVGGLVLVIALAILVPVFQMAQNMNKTMNH
jgi:type IV pilus assembly protein PilC